MKKKAIVKDSTNEIALRNFYEFVDKDQFLEALRSHPSEPYGEEKETKWQLMARMLSAPGGKHPSSLSSLCKHMGISVKQVAGYYADYQRSRGLMALMNHLPKAMEDVAKDAVNNRLTSCPKCLGEKEIEDAKGKMRKCRHCLGTGNVLVAADKDARMMTFKMAGMLQEGKGPLVAIQTNINQTGLEENVVDVGKLLEE